MRKLTLALALTLAMAGNANAQTDTTGRYMSPNQTTTPRDQTGAYDNTNTTTSQPMPRTASAMPLVGLAGAAALAAGIWLTSVRRPES